MQSIILNGKSLAKTMLLPLSKRVATFELATGHKPTLNVIMVGNNHASAIYVNNKRKRALEIGIECQVQHLSEDISESALLDVIYQCNDNKMVHGIIVQLPLPKHINVTKVIEAIAIEKDVDGFHPTNVGKLYSGRDDTFVACTAKACLYLIHEVFKDVTSKNIVIIGRSNIVGRPLAALLLKENATVTICHSFSKNIEEHTSKADIVICAIGYAKFFSSKFFNTKAVVIDVGINRLSDGTLSGDVDYEHVKNSVMAITPVPGGVGPMTIALLLENTMIAAERSLENIA